MSEGVLAVELERFRSLLRDQLGLRFRDHDASRLRALLASRALETRTASAAAYLDSVAPSGGELAELARALTVSETYFFRNRAQFDALQAILRRRESKGERHLRVLSAACASGEEAYSLAIATRETLQRPEQWTISIIGCDLNAESVRMARRARYRPWSLRATDPARRDRYFRRRGGQFFLIDEVKDWVRFEKDNLVQPRSALWGAEALDIVFCRNVLMYLDRDAARRVVGHIARSLSPGGYLFLGHAENLRGISSDFDVEQSHGTFYYRRRGRLDHALRRSGTLRSPPGADGDPNPWFEDIARASSRIEQLHARVERGEGERLQLEPAGGHDVSERSRPPRAGWLTSAVELMRQERFRDALEILASTPELGELGSDARLLHAMLLVCTGDLGAAEELCLELLGSDEPRAAPHYILALCREHAGDTKQSIDHSRAAAYFDTNFAMPHLQLGRLARRAGELATAKRELEFALALLPREDTTRIMLFGGGFGRDALVQLCRSELEACERKS